MRRSARWALGLVAVALLALALLLAAGTAPLLRLLLGPGSEALRGSLWTGLEAHALSGQTADGTRWQLQGLALAPLRWRAGALDLSLQLQTLTLQLAPGTPRKAALDEAALLRQLRAPLPLPLRVQRLQIARLQLDTLALSDLEAQGSWGLGEPLLHLPVLRARWQDVSLQAQAQLQASGALALAVQAQRQTLQLQLQGDGRLAALALQLTLREAAQTLLTGQARLEPLALQPLASAQLQWRALDPRRLHALAPQGRWQGDLHLRGEPDGRLHLRSQARNAAAARFDAQGWPLRQFELALHLDPRQWQALQVQSLLLELGDAQHSAGTLRLAEAQALPQLGQPLRTRLRLEGVRLNQLDAGWPDLQLEGELALAQAALDAQAALQWRTQLQARTQRQPAWTLQAQGSLQGQSLRVEKGQLAGAGERGRMDFSGALDLRQGHSSGVVQAQGLRLALAPWPNPSLWQGDARWQAQRSGAQWQGEVALTLAEGSHLGGQALRGQASLRAGPDASPWQLALQAGTGQQLQAQGQGPGVRSPAQWREAQAWLPQQLDWQLDDLGALRELWQPWLQTLAGQSRGRYRSEAGGQLSLQDLKLQARDQPLVRLRALQLDWQGALPHFKLSASGLQAARGELRQLQAQGGPDEPWQLEADGSWGDPGAPEPPRQARLSLRSQAPERTGDDWRWPQLQAQLQGLGETLSLRSPALQFSPASQQLQLAPGELQLGEERLQWQQARVDRSGNWALALQGSPRLAPWLSVLDRRVQWQGDARADLQLRAESGQPTPRLEVQGQNLRGDLQLDGQPLGLQALALSAQQQHDGSGSLQAQLRSTLLGELQLQLRQDPARALAGTLDARLPRLATLRPWLPVGLQIEGQAQLQARLTGTRAQPELRGELGVQLDRLQHPASGIGGQRGMLQARFDESGLRLETLQMDGLGEQGGYLRGSGSLRWQGTQPEAKLNLEAKQWRLLNRFDRRLALSGQTQLTLQPKSLRLRGALTADEGQFEIGRGEAPSLDADVRVVDTRQSTAPPAPPRSDWQRDIELALDLGQRLRVQGRGFAARLTGQLQLVDRGGKPAQWTGRIDTQGGRYKAYGQTLDLETGALRFTGALDNPRLEMLAIKPDIEHRVGVSVGGTLQRPVMRLYAEPDLPDNDKLAWLLLGRDPSEISGRDTALLQRAALALLSGEEENAASALLDRLGITELSLSQGEDAATVLRLSARLSQRWSLGYERSLNAATGNWQLVYRLGQRFRLRAQGGAESALDLLWLWRYD